MALLFLEDSIMSCFLLHHVWGHYRRMTGFLHLYSGEEAIAAGVMSVLNTDDYIASHHRGHGHLLAKGGDPKRMFAELFGRRDGYCRGKGGSMHIADRSLGILGANGIVGASLPIGTGAALASKMRNDGRVAVAFFGDAAANRGTFHESLNLGACWRLPVVYVCENNLYGVSTRQTDAMKITDIADRAAGYGFPGVVVDGNDVVAVREAAAEAVDRARRGGGPTLIEGKTWRHWGHFVGDSAAYRDPVEHEAWLKRDPILVCARVLEANKWAARTDLEKIQAEADAEIEAAMEFAKNSPWPDRSELLTDIYPE